MLGIRGHAQNTQRLGGEGSLINNQISNVTRGEGILQSTVIIKKNKKLSRDGEVRIYCGIRATKTIYWNWHKVFS
jgi:hypothetical protein